HSPLLPQHVVTAVATHREQPFSDMPRNVSRRLGHEADESILNDIARPVGIAPEQPGGVTKERRLMARDRLLHKGAGFNAVMALFRFDIHETLLLLRTINGFIRTSINKSSATSCSRPQTGFCFLP